MNIGILTYHAACNFGANLQALSTVLYFKNKGYDVKIIDYLPDELDKFYINKTPSSQYEEHKKFREFNLPLTRKCKNEIEVAKVIDEESFDMVVIGSDAVMQHHPLLSRIIFPCRKIITIYHPTSDRMCPNPFWGSFASLLQRQIPICYMSASSQNSAYKQLTISENKLLREHLEGFSYISTRDDWSAQMVTRITRGAIKPSITPDPVFAFNYNVLRQPSEAEIRDKFNIKGDYYLLSFHNSKTVSQEWLKTFESLTQKDDAQCIALAFPQGVEFKHPFKKEISTPLSPIDWYALIKYSKGYIGHNMHPIVVSLHNSVPCFSFDHYGIVKWRIFAIERSSKIYHIMKEFGVLENRVSTISAHYTAPSPEFVYEKLLNFNSAVVSKNAARFLDAYLKMMSEIENVIY